MRRLHPDDIRAIAELVLEGLAEATHAGTHFLSTQQAASYLGMHSRAGIRHLVYSGELVPDGRGWRNGYVFTVETLERFVKQRQARLDGEQGDGDRYARRRSSASRRATRRGQVVVGPSREDPFAGVRAALEEQRIRFGKGR